MRKRLLRSPLLWVIVLYLLAQALIWSGAFGFLEPDGVINPWSLGTSAGAYAVAAYAMARVVMLFRKSRFAFAAVVIGMLIAAGIAETGLRWLHPAGARLEYRLWHSNRFHHINPPSREMYHGFDGDTRLPILVNTNADGFRSGYTPETFGTHAVRIAVLGDSFTFGLFNRQEAAYPQVLERLLRERLHRDDIAVLNAGVVSYSPFLGGFVLDEVVRKYRPTHVIYMLDASDFGDDFQYARMAVEGEGADRFPKSVVADVFRSGPSRLDHSAVMQRVYTPFSFMRAFMMHPIAMASSESNPMMVHGLEIDGERQGDRFFIYRYPLEKTRPFLDRTRAHIDRLAELAGEMDARFLLVVAPRYHHWNPEESPYNWESYAYSTDEPYQFAYLEYFDEIAPEAGYPIYNLLETFQAAKDEGPFCFRVDAHWNARGHALVANALAGYIVEHKLVVSADANP